MQTYAADPQLQLYACCLIASVYFYTEKEVGNLHSFLYLLKSLLDVPYTEQSIGTILTLMKSHTNLGVICYGLFALAAFASQSSKLTIH
jgi:hypothetical protein